MSVFGDFALESINAGLALISKCSPVSCSDAGKALRIAGATLEDLGTKIEDGKISKEEFDDALMIIQQMDNAVVLDIVKSAIGRVIGKFV